MEKCKPGRRAFLKASAGLALFGPAAIAERLSVPADPLPMPVGIFSKHLQWLDYEEMARTAARLGFDGIDLTVRPGGHVQPERVEEDLPRAVEAAQRSGIRIMMLTTSIRRASDPHCEEILRTAAGLGIDLYRMGWYKYDRNSPIVTQVDQNTRRLSEMAGLNQVYKIRGAYQNHAGLRFGAAIWDLWQALKEIDSPWLGCQYDIRHAMVESAGAWPAGLDLIAPHINSIDIKDFRWQSGRIENVPLGRGQVDFAGYFRKLSDLEVRKPISLHLEYPLGGAEKGKSRLNTSPETVLKAIRSDLTYLRSSIPGTLKQ